MQDQEARSRRVVQVRPSQLDLLQLAQDFFAEVADGEFVAGLVRVQAKLTVDLTPGEPLRSTEGEGAVDQPEVEIEAQGTSFEGRKSVHVERYRVTDDLVEKVLAEADLAVPQRPLVGLALVPPELTPVGDVTRIRIGPRVYLRRPSRRCNRTAASFDCGAGLGLAAAVVDTEFPHEFGKRVAQDDHPALGAYRFRAEPSHQEARKVAVGELIVSARNQD